MRSTRARIHLVTERRFMGELIEVTAGRLTHKAARVTARLLPFGNSATIDSYVHERLAIPPADGRLSASGTVLSGRSNSAHGRMQSVPLGRGMFSARAAFANEGEVLGCQGESVGFVETPPEVGELVLWDLDYRWAVLADEVAMGLAGEMKRRWAVAQVDVGYHAELFEGSEGAVDGGLGDVGEPGADRGGDVLCVEVAGVAEEDLDGGPARRGDAPTVGPKLRQHSVSRCGLR